MHLPRLCNYALLSFFNFFAFFLSGPTFFIAIVSPLILSGDHFWPFSSIFPFVAPFFDLQPSCDSTDIMESPDQWFDDPFLPSEGYSSEEWFDDALFSDEECLSASAVGGVRNPVRPTSGPASIATDLVDPPLDCFLPHVV